MPIVNMRKLLDEDKVAEIPQKDIELTREYVRRFVNDLAPIIEEKQGAKTRSKQSKKRRK